MFTLLNLVQPDTIEAAYKELVGNRNNIVLGGCAFLRMGSQRIGTAIDLSRLNLNYIVEQNEYVEVGATTTFRDIETNPILNRYFNGVLPEALSQIIGIQFRNTVMIGATVYSKYGFSDLLTALLALDTEIELYKSGRMSLKFFLENSFERDILTRIFIKKNERKANYQHLRNSSSDYPILNVAVSKLNDQWKIVVGARPQRAIIVQKASEELTNSELNSKNIDRIATMASNEITFGTNMRGTADYRKSICKVLVKRAILEVFQCK